MGELVEYFKKLDDKKRSFVSSGHTDVAIGVAIAEEFKTRTPLGQDFVYKDLEIDEGIINKIYYQDKPEGTGFIKLDEKTIDKGASKFVRYWQGAICYTSVPDKSDFISRPFSGCYMAIYTDKGKERQGAHIYRGEKKDQASLWNEVSKEFTNIILFKPESFPSYNIKPEVWGIISADNPYQCYTVYVYKEGNECQKTIRCWFHSIKEIESSSDNVIPERNMDLKIPIQESGSCCRI